MLTSFVSKIAANAKAYFLDGLARDDFEANHYGHSQTGHWRGQAATLLGLSSEVRRSDFFAMCDNILPDTGERLTPRTKDDRRVGIDFTFSAPKGVSLLYAFAGRAEILECFRLAVADAMLELETDTQTRVRIGNTDKDRHTGNLVWAEFIHSTSRPVNGFSAMQLHAHCFAFNTTHDGEECRWKAAQFGEIKRNMPYYESVFLAGLSQRLERLGYETVERGRSFELKDVPEDLIRRFSPRTDVIKEYIQRKGVEDPKEKAKAAARTRRSKANATKGRSVEDDWKNAVTGEERSLLNGLRNKFKAAGEDRSVRQAFDYALAKQFERSGVVHERHMLNDLHRIARRTFSKDELRGEYALRGITSKQSNGRTLLISPEAVTRERRLVEIAREGRGRFSPLADHAIMRGGTDLSAKERMGVARALESQDSITLVQTRTTAQSEAMLKTFVDSIGSNTPRGLLNRAVLRPPVVVLSPTAERARGSLPEHGISDATTVHSFLNSFAQKTNAFTAGIIWVEDANKLTTRDLLAVAEQSRNMGSRLFLAGDPTMNSAWTKGNGMSLLRDHAGLDGVKVHENTRQKSLLRDVTNSFARGQIENGFRGLDQLDALKETDSKNLARLAAENYVQRTKAGESVALLGGNRDEVKELNKQARDTLKSDGQLKKSKTFQQLVPTDSSEADRRRSDFYEAGQVVQFGKHAAGFKAGSRWNVIGHDPFNNVAITNGSTLKSLPLSKADRFQVYNPQTIEVSIGEKLRITRGAMVYSVSETVFNQFRQRPDFPTHEIHSGAEYKVKRFTRDGRIQLDNNFVLDKTFGHIDYGYARTAASATRKPDDHVILSLRGHRSPDTALRDLTAGLGNARWSATLFTDDAEKLMGAVSKSPVSYNALDHVSQERAEETRRVESRVREQMRADARTQERDSATDKEMDCGR